eukprot:scaffold37682_cov183-Skeletonema_marinoi.AAC.6
MSTAHLVAGGRRLEVAWRWEGKDETVSQYEKIDHARLHTTAFVQLEKKQAVHLINQFYN